MVTHVISNPGARALSLYPFGTLIPGGGSINVTDEELSLAIVKAVGAGLLTSTPPLAFGLEEVVDQEALNNVDDIQDWVSSGDSAFVFDGADPRAGVLLTRQLVDVVIVDLGGRKDPFSKLRRITITSDANGGLIDPNVPGDVSALSKIVTFRTVRSNGVLVKKATVSVLGVAAAPNILTLTDPDASGLGVADTLTINWA